MDYTLAFTFEPHNADRKDSGKKREKKTLLLETVSKQCRVANPVNAIRAIEENCPAVCMHVLKLLVLLVHTHLSSTRGGPFVCF